MPASAPGCGRLIIRVHHTLSLSSIDMGPVLVSRTHSTVCFMVTKLRPPEKTCQPIRAHVWPAEGDSTLTFCAKEQDEVKSTSDNFPHIFYGWWIVAAAF